MTTFLFILISIFNEPCSENVFITEEINNRDLIAIAQINEEFDERMNSYQLNGLVTSEIFKGSGNSLIAIDPRGFYFEKGKTYLIFVNYENDQKSPYISDCSKTKETSDVDSIVLEHLYTSVGSHTLF